MKRLGMVLFISFYVLGMTSAVMADSLVENRNFEVSIFSTSMTLPDVTLKPWEISNHFPYFNDLNSPGKKLMCPNVMIEPGAIGKHCSIFNDLNLSGMTFPFFNRSGCLKDRIDSWLSLDNTATKTSVYPVPEPATMLLFGIGLIGFSAFRNRIIR